MTRLSLPGFGRTRTIVNLLVFALPASSVKNRALRLLGHRIAASARIGPTVVWGNPSFDVGEEVVVGFGNTFRDLVSVTLGHHTMVGQLNWFSTIPALHDRGPAAGSLLMGAHSAVVSRHHLDCSGGIDIGEYATISGHRSTFLTHQIDYRTATVATQGIRVGARALVSSHNSLVSGAVVPALSVTALGSVVLPGLETEGRLYAGVPARDVGPVTGDYFTRTRGYIDPRDRPGTAPAVSPDDGQDAGAAP